MFGNFGKQDAAKMHDVSGRGRGLIAVLDVKPGALSGFAGGSRAGGPISQMNSPWGLVVAPSTFGEHANQLLVGNFGSGTIMTFDANGHFKGLLERDEDRPVTIDGLWGLTFGADGGVSGVATDLYFSAGPNDEQHGLFGVIQAVSGDDDSDGHEQNN